MFGQQSLVYVGGSLVYVGGCEQVESFQYLFFKYSITMLA